MIRVMPAKGMKVDELKLAEAAAAALARLRERAPLVMSLTNTVVENWTANCLLAVGARPAMVAETDEAVELAARSGAVLVNVGTLTARQAEAMRGAVASANRHGVPWVLDPVAVDKLAFRRREVERLIGLKPRMIRANRGEIDFLRGTVPTASLEAIALLATGEVDEIAMGAGSVPVRLANGVPMLARVTGTGCAQGALAAAFCAVEPSPVVAAVATALTMAIAGEIAFAAARRPGSFQVALLDVLDAVRPEDLKERARFA